MSTLGSGLSCGTNSSLRGWPTTVQVRVECGQIPLGFLKRESRMVEAPPHASNPPARTSTSRTVIDTLPEHSMDSQLVETSPAPVVLARSSRSAVALTPRAQENSTRRRAASLHLGGLVLTRYGRRPVKRSASMPSRGSANAASPRASKILGFSILKRASSPSGCRSFSPGSSMTGSRKTKSKRSRSTF